MRISSKVSDDAMRRLERTQMIADLKAGHIKIEAKRNKEKQMIDERDEFVCCECDERLKDHAAVYEHVVKEQHHSFKSNKYPNLIMNVG